MPDRAIVEAFVAEVVSGRHVEAIERFYTAGATMQENQSPPRAGRELLMEHERRALARSKSVDSRQVGPAMIDGNHVAIRWVFAFTLADGTVRSMEEVAWQRWEGDKIAEETFFYDPAQMRG
jgi:hypothetical protein